MSRMLDFMRQIRPHAVALLSRDLSMKMYAPASFLTGLLHPFFDRVVTALAHTLPLSPSLSTINIGSQANKISPRSGQPPRARILANTLDF
ncbi:hypothetical protein B0G69_7053 [Paraburkholderia sp. RAU2J]|nr:hypothetical protein B0G69_7053 [Paraburkholderia sp. RAU2J]